EHSWYSVISPEGCAAILWRDAAKAPDAAEALKLAAPDLIDLEIIDRIVPEPSGGAHRDHAGAARALASTIDEYLDTLIGLSVEELLERRLEKFRKMGVFCHE
ncbi:MAG: acetyl-CoA carboxylase carboxyl transferase subunit alpha, partial [candidate division Zixibacteria bacterium]|nr:acetyl-CoA carboxylase carboxyl transferase subunit alpha [candidate division Zixibacteria bacterium]